MKIKFLGSKFSSVEFQRTKFLCWPCSQSMNSIGINHFSNTNPTDLAPSISTCSVLDVLDLREGTFRKLPLWNPAVNEPKLTWIRWFGLCIVAIDLQTIQPFGQCDLFIIIHITISWHFFATFFQHPGIKKRSERNWKIGMDLCGVQFTHTSRPWPAHEMFSILFVPTLCSYFCRATRNWVSPRVHLH